MGQSIKHSVIFSFKSDVGEADAENFIKQSSEILTSIETVKNFKHFKQTSPKNKYDFVFAMEFDDQSAYDYYLNHPVHLKYVAEKWDVYVGKFLEIDYNIGD